MCDVWKQYLAPKLRYPHTSLHGVTNRKNVIKIFFLSFLVWSLLPTTCRRRGLLLQLITLHYSRTRTLGRTPLYEGSARYRHLYLTIHTNHKWQTSMSPAGFEPAILESERPQIRALDSSATAIGHYIFHYCENIGNSLFDCFLYFLNPRSFFNISVFISFSILFIPLCRVSLNAHFAVPVFFLSFYLLLFLYILSLQMNLHLTAIRRRFNEALASNSRPEDQLTLLRSVWNSSVSLGKYLEIFHDHFISRHYQFIYRQSFYNSKLCIFWHIQ